MTRRAWLRLGTTATVFVLAGYRPVQLIYTGRRVQPAGAQLADLNPDRMWPVYRRYHLLIVGQRDDAKNTAFAAATADTLVHFLPASRAQATGYGRHKERRLGSSPPELIGRLLLSELENATRGQADQKTEPPEENGS